MLCQWLHKHQTDETKHFNFKSVNLLCLVLDLNFVEKLARVTSLTFQHNLNFHLNRPTAHTRLSIRFFKNNLQTNA